jgi:hypothetical protein
VAIYVFCCNVGFSSGVVLFFSSLSVVADSDPSWDGVVGGREPGGGQLLLTCAFGSGVSLSAQVPVGALTVRAGL